MATEYLSGYEILEMSGKMEGLAKHDDANGGAIEAIFKALIKYQRQNGEVTFKWVNQKTGRRELQQAIIDRSITADHDIFTRPNFYGIANYLDGGNLLSVSAKKKACYTRKKTTRTPAITKQRITVAGDSMATGNESGILKILEEMRKEHKEMRNESKASADTVQDEFLKVGKKLEAVATMDYVNDNLTKLDQKINNIANNQLEASNTVKLLIAEEISKVNFRTDNSSDRMAEDTEELFLSQKRPNETNLEYNQILKKFEIRLGVVQLFTSGSA